MVEKDGWFIKTLINAYDGVMHTNAQPISMGGSTFARAFNKGCAFGCSFEGYDNKIHDAGENERFQFVRTGYFIRDSKDANCWNSIVPLKESKSK